MKEKSPDILLQQEENPESAELRKKVILYLKEFNPPYIHKISNNDVWETDAIYELFLQNPTLTQFRTSSGKKIDLNKNRFFDLFKYEEVFSTLLGVVTPEKQRLFFFPQSKEDMSDPQKLAELYRQSPWGPWNLGKVSDWNARLELASGEEITIRELFDAYSLAREQAEPGDIERELRDAVEDHFEKLGIILEHKLSNGQTITTWDIDRLKECDTSILDSFYAHDFAGPWRAKQKTIVSFSGIVRLFRDTKVISENDFSKLKGKTANQQHEKYLFALPKNQEDAFDSEAIKAEILRSYIKPADLGGHVASWDAHVACRNGEPVSLAELHIAQTLIGDMNAERVGDTLMVDGTNGSRVRFAADRFRQTLRISAFANNPTEYAQSNLPNILRAGILRLSDLGVTAEKGGKLRRGEHEVRKNGEVYINGLWYNLGSRYDTRKKSASQGHQWHVSELTPDIAGVLQTMGDESQRLVAGFRLLNREEKFRKKDALKAHLTKKSGVEPSKERLNGARVGAKEIEWIADETLLGTKRLPGESDEHFLKRGRQVPDFDVLRDVTDSLAQETAIGIHRALSVQEQLWLAAAAHEPGNKDRIVNSTKKYGIPFLRTFLSCEYGTEKGALILSLAENAAVPDETKMRLFSAYAQLADSAESVASFLQENYGDLFSEEIAHRTAEHLLAKGKDIIVASEQSLKKRSEQTRVFDELSRLDANALMLKKSFLETKLRHPDLNFDVKAFDFQFVSSDELRARPDTIEQMKKIYRKNCAAARYSESYADALLSTFESNAQNPDSRFYILFNADTDRVLAFDCFTPVSGGAKEFTAVNVDPDWKSAKIGETLIEQTLERESENGSRIIATANPVKPIAQNYIERHRFVAVGTATKEDGTFLLHIERDPRRPRRESQNLTEDALLRKAHYFRPNANALFEAEKENPDQLFFSCDESVLTSAERDELYSPLKNGYMLARYFKKDRVSYFVFEKAGFKKPIKRVS